MSYILLAFGFPTHIATTTDLLCTELTKTGSAITYSYFRNIDWHILGILAPVSNVGTILILGILPSIDATTNYD